MSARCREDTWPGRLRTPAHGLEFVIALTIYTFGYCGCGNHTKRLIESVNAVKRHRGFRPPVFAEIRIQRPVTA